MKSDERFLTEWVADEITFIGKRGNFPDVYTKEGMDRLAQLIRDKQERGVIGFHMLVLPDELRRMRPITQMVEWKWVERLHKIPSFKKSLAKATAEWLARFESLDELLRAAEIGAAFSQHVVRRQAQ